MAKEYIERKAVIDLLKNKYQDMSAMPASYYAGFQYALKMVEAMNPAADVAQVRHGEWKEMTRQIDRRDCWVYCSNCGYMENMICNAKLPRYCPDCGAKMDLEG